MHSNSRTFGDPYGPCSDLLEVPAQPDGREVSPAQLAHDMVLVEEQVTYLHRMVSTCNTQRSSGINRCRSLSWQTVVIRSVTEDG